MRRIISLILFSLLMWAQAAPAAVVFQVRGDSTDARYSSSGKESFVIHKNTDTAPVATALVAAGVFGSSVIPLNAATFTQQKEIYWPGRANFSSTAKFTILIRIVPAFTSGAIGGEINLFTAGIPLNGNNSSYLELEINVDSTIEFTLRDRVQGTDIDHFTSSAFAFTSGTPTDIIVTWDDTASPKLSFGQDGAVISTASPAGSSFATRWAKWPYLGMGHRPGDGVATTMSNFSINEIVVYDTAEVITSFAGRSAFITTTAFDGQSNSSPGDANVKTGVAYTVAGVAGTGTYDGSDRHTDPGIANVRSGTAYKSNSTTNNRTGTAAIPAAANVRSGTATDATTGTLAVPAAADVRSGTAVDATTGTAAIPIAANVRSGTATDATTGTLSVPSAANVRNGTAVDAGTGTLVVPAANEVKIGVVYDGATTGTYVASERYTDPGITNVRNGTAYAFNSATNNRTGTLAAITFGSSTSSLDSTQVGAEALFITKGDGPLNARVTIKTDGTALAVTGGTFKTYFQKQTGGWLEIGNSGHTIIESGASNVGVVDVALTAAQTALLKSGKALRFYTAVTLSGSTVRFWGTIKEVRERPAAVLWPAGLPGYAKRWAPRPERPVLWRRAA